MWLAAFLLLVPLRLAASTVDEDPTVLARAALRAVEGDSSSAFAAPFARRAAHDPRDRAALFALATVARLTDNYDRADSLYARALAVGPAGDRWAAYLEVGRGLGLAARTRHERADSLLAHAALVADSAGAGEAEGQALVALAYIRLRTVGTSAARELLDRAAARIPRAALASRAERQCAAAFLAVRQAVAGALDSADAGAALASRAREPAIRAGCEFIRAQELERRGSFARAIMTLERDAEPVLRRTHHRHLLAAVLQWHGYLEFRLGNYAAARDRLSEAVQEASASQHGSALAWAHVGLAQMASNLGDLATERREVDAARALLTAQSDLWGLATVRSLDAELARALHDPAEARRANVEAIGILTAIGNDYASLERYRALAILEQEEGDWRASERWLTIANQVARGRPAPGWWAELPVHEAANAMLRGDLREADSVLRRAEGDTTDSNDPKTQYALAARHAEVLARLGDLSGVERKLTAAAAAFADWRAAQATSRDFRLELLQSRESWGYSGAGIPLAIATLARGGRVASAFRFAEERRARELLARLAQRELGGAAGARTAGAERAADLDAIALDSVMRVLPLSSAIVEVVAGRDDESMVAFVITHDSSTIVSLSTPDAVAPEVERFVSLLGAGSDAPTLARGLGDAVLAPVLARLPARVTHLVLVPDGVLHRVPFEALRTSDGRLLVERMAVSLAPSATVLYRLAQRPARTRAPALLAFGDPAYDEAAAPRTPTADEMRARFIGAGGLSPLPGSAREAHDVARYFARADVLVGAQASEAALRLAARRAPTVIHLATHALVDDQVLWRSALALAPDGGDDGFVGAGELASLTLDADLVVLSGCRTASGVVMAGEGVQGLAAPLLEAGARAVLATRWALGDRDAGPLVDRIYGAMARGETVADALHDAEVDALHRGAPPNVWGAFTLVGDADVRPLAGARAESAP